MQDLAQLARAILSYGPDNPDGAVAIQEAILNATSSQPGGPTSAEALLTCILESLLSAGDAGKELLDQLLLEVLPHIAALAPVSEKCAGSLFSLCGLAAEACGPRDVITALLEVMDQLSSGSQGPNVLHFMCNLVGLLPQLLLRLSRRKAAFVVECLMPVAKVAQAQGEVLQGWMLEQLWQAGSQDARDTLRRMDTFMAANWQQYEEFVSVLVHKVLPEEPDKPARQSAQAAVGHLILQLLVHLTAAWPPPGMVSVAAQVVAGPSAAQPLPTAASVAAPKPSICTAAAGAGPSTATATLNPTDSLTAASSMTSSWAPSSCSLQHTQQETAQVVCCMLHLLQDCGVCGWQIFAETAGTEAAGAALAVLYQHSLGHMAGNTSWLPQEPVTTIQVACLWCLSLSETDDGNPIVALKCVALLQLAAAHAAAQQAVPQAATASEQYRQATAGQSRPQTGTHAASEAALPHDYASIANRLLPHLEPCVNMLAGILAQAPGTVLGAQAGMALSQLLQALPAGVSRNCLQQLLCSERHVHPEVAALLMQEVRHILTKTQGAGPLSSIGSVQLVRPWLLQHGQVGWEDIEGLTEQANAICAALAVIRLVLLRAKAKVLPAVSELGSGSDVTTAGHPIPERLAYAELQQLLQQPLQALSGAVAQALEQLQTVNQVEQQQQSQPGFAGSDGQQTQQQQQRLCVPGEAVGAGQAVDAWLAVSRVQEVLDRVLELLR